MAANGGIDQSAKATRRVPYRAAVEEDLANYRAVIDEELAQCRAAEKAATDAAELAQYRDQSAKATGAEADERGAPSASFRFPVGFGALI